MTNATESPPPSSAIPRLQLLVLLTLLLSFAIVAGVLFFTPAPVTARPMLALLLILAFATSVLSLADSLPIQNVITVSAIIAVLSSITEILNTKTHLPFGHRFWPDSSGPQILHLLPWAVPFLWVVVLLSSRGLARFLLSPLRSRDDYGILSLGSTTLLAVIFAFGLERFAAINHLWSWPDSSAAAWPNFLGWAGIAFIILALATPWLINKKPVAPPPPDYPPVILWFLSMIFFLACR